MENSGEAGAAIFAIIMMVLMWAGMFLLIIGVMVLWVLALVDVVKREFAEPNEKLIWVLVICLTGWLGALIYLAIGKKKGWLPGEGAGTKMHPPPPT